jgi:hypothetical protein
VVTLLDFNKDQLLLTCHRDTIHAIENLVSLNHILHAFQMVYHQYNFDFELVDRFLISMEMDLQQKEYDRAGYEAYILGSAEVVGLMCLKVFTEGDIEQYKKLTPFAMRLGAAFQKINFLEKSWSFGKTRMHTTSVRECSICFYKLKPDVKRHGGSPSADDFDRVAQRGTDATDEHILVQVSVWFERGVHVFECVLKNLIEGRKNRHNSF